MVSEFFNIQLESTTEPKIPSLFKNVLVPWMFDISSEYKYIEEISANHISAVKQGLHYYFVCIYGSFECIYFFSQYFYVFKNDLFHFSFISTISIDSSIWTNNWHNKITFLQNLLQLNWYYYKNLLRSQIASKWTRIIYSSPFLAVTNEKPIVTLPINQHLLFKYNFQNVRLNRKWWRVCKQNYYFYFICFVILNIQRSRFVHEPEWIPLVKVN